MNDDELQSHCTVQRKQGHLKRLRCISFQNPERDALGILFIIVNFGRKGEKEAEIH